MIWSMIADTQVYQIGNGSAIEGTPYVGIKCEINKDGKITLFTKGNEGKFCFIDTDSEVLQGLVECFRKAIELAREKKKKNGIVESGKD